MKSYLTILHAVTVADFIASHFFAESKAMKQAHSWLRNCFINAAIGKKWPLENRNRGRVKYIPFVTKTWLATATE